MKWKTKKLDDACEVEYGTRVVNKKHGGSKYPVYGGGGATFFMDRDNREDRMVIARFAMSEQCTRFIKGKFFLNDSGLTVSPKNKKEISQDFLDLQLYFLNDFIYSLARGTAQKNLDVPAFRNMEISYPESISEQYRIVKILDEVFEKLDKVKENAEKNLQNSKALYESYLQNIFANPGKDWEEKTLGEVCDFYNGKAHEKAIDANGAYIVVNSKFVSSNGEKYKRTKKALFPLVKDDIAMVMSDVPNGKALAKCFIVDKNDTYSLNQRICAIRSKVFQTRFLYLQLNRHKYLLGFNNGENQTNLRKNDILDCPLFVPPISIQKSIIAKLDSLSGQTKELEGIYKQKIIDLKELKKSVLNKAFTGEL